MSKKKNRHEARMRAKKAAKAAKQKSYAAMKGTSKKLKKIRVRTRAGASPHKHQHLVENCGNIGCERCFPEFVRKILNGRVIDPAKLTALAGF